jgi:hypothetical protein
MNTINLPFGLVLSRPKKETALHPEYKKSIQFAFTIDGEDYYEFTNLGDMPQERYKKFNDLATQCDWRMSIDDLKDMLALQKKAVNKGKLTDIMDILNAFEYCLSIYIETDLFMVLFSCLFFTKDEDLTDYDYDLGVIKTAKFKQNGIPSFFLSEPVKKYLPQVDISEQDMKVFSGQTSVKKEYLQSTIQRVSKNLELQE